MSTQHLQGKKIFIDGDRGIGDMLVLTPAFRRLKEICPSCELTVGAYEMPAVQALERLPYIDHVRRMEDRGLSSKIRTAWQLHRYDYVVLTGYRPVLARFLHYFGVKHLSGTGKEKHLRKGWFEVMTPQSDGKIARNVVRAICGDVFRSLHLVDEEIKDYACDCSLPTAEEEKALRDKIIRGGNLTELKEYVVIAPEGFTALNIPYRLLEPLTAYLQERLNCPIVFMGKDTRALTDKLKEAVPEAQLIDISGQTTVMEMFALLKNAKLAITVDSGPMHIACALGTKTVAYFTTSPPIMWRPDQNCYPVSADVDCSPCKKGGPQYCSDRKCESLIDWAVFKKSVEEGLG